MSQFLTGLNNTAGVVGCAAFDLSNNCIGHLLPPPFEPVLLAQVATEVMAATAMVTASELTSTSNFVLVEGEIGRVIVRQFEQAVVVAILETRANIAMVNVALNVVGAKLNQVVPDGQLNSSRPAMQVVSGSFPPAQASSGSFPPAQSGGYPSAPHARAQSVATHVEVDTVGKPILKQVLDAFQRGVGPACRVLFKDELNNLGATASTLRSDQYQIFVERLSLKLSPQLRANFLKEVQPLKG